MRNLFFLLLLLAPHMANAEDTGRLILDISKVQSLTGNFIVSVYKNDKSFLKQADKEFIFPLRELLAQEDARFVIELPAMPFGSFSIGVVHDIDDDKKMNTKVFGIPAEPVGFSNNPRNKFGPPRFSQTVFSFLEDGQKVTIILINI